MKILKPFNSNLSFLALASMAFFITPVSAMDLEEVYKIAETSDPQFKQVAAAKRAVLELRPQAIAGFLPSASISANTTSNDQDITIDGFFWLIWFYQF